MQCTRHRLWSAGGWFLLAALCLAAAPAARAQSAPGETPRQEERKKERKERKKRQGDDPKPADTESFVQKGTQVGEFGFPQFDAAGRLSGRLRGTSSTYLGGSRYSVDGVVYTALTNGVSDFTFDTRSSEFDKDTTLLTSSAPVSFRQGDFSLSGDGLRWNLKENRGTVLSNVTVFLPPRAPSKP